jgi:hypothetical protein
MVSMPVLIVYLVVITVYLCGCLAYHLRDAREERSAAKGKSSRYAPRQGEAHAIRRVADGVGDDTAGHGERRGNQDHPDHDITPQVPKRHGPSISAPEQPAAPPDEPSLQHVGDMDAVAV